MGTRSALHLWWSTTPPSTRQPQPALSQPGPQSRLSVRHVPGLEASYLIHVPEVVDLLSVHVPEVVNALYVHVNASSCSSFGFVSSRFYGSCFSLMGSRSGFISP